MQSLNKLHAPAQIHSSKFEYKDECHIRSWSRSRCFSTSTLVVGACSAGLFVLQLRTEGESRGLYTSLVQTKPWCPHGTFPWFSPTPVDKP